MSINVHFTKYMTREDDTRLLLYLAVCFNICFTSRQERKGRKRRSAGAENPIKQSRHSSEMDPNTTKKPGFSGEGLLAKEEIEQTWKEVQTWMLPCNK